MAWPDHSVLLPGLVALVQHLRGWAGQGGCGSAGSFQPQPPLSDPLWSPQELGCGASLGVISDNLLVTGGQGCVSFWDIGYGDLLQTVYLGKSNESQPARQILVLENAAIVCNFGSELSLVYVPSVLEKLD